MSILAFSNWRWFEGKNRANNKTDFFILWNSWLGWVGLGWVGWDGLGWDGLALWGGHVYSFGTFVHSCIHKLEMVCGKKRANKKTSFFIFWNSWLGWVGLGWVGLGWVGGHVYSFGTFVHSCILKLEMVCGKKQSQ